MSCKTINDVDAADVVVVEEDCLTNVAVGCFLGY